MLGAFVFAAALAASPDQAAAAATSPATPAPAAATPVSHTAANQLGVSDPNRVTCHTEETTGTRLGATRVCMTTAQWEARAAENEQVLNGYQQQRGFNKPN